MGSRAWRGANNWAWSKVRAVVLNENLMTNEGRCTLRLEGCTTRAEEVHHILGRAMTGDDPRYLTATCRSCNIKVGNPSSISPPHRSVSSW